MHNKTCGECIWFDSSVCLCCRSIDHFGEAYSDTNACLYGITGGARLDYVS